MHRNRQGSLTREDKEEQIAYWSCSRSNKPGRTDSLEVTHEVVVGGRGDF